MARGRRIGKFTRIHFAIADSSLQGDVERGIMSHFPDTFGMGCFHGSDPRTVLDDTSAYLLVVGVSALPNDTDLAVIETAQQKEQPCGIIVRTEDRSKWEKLSSLHERFPFRIVVAVGGPRHVLKRMFPGTLIISDVLDLINPGKQIASAIWDVSGKEEERYLAA